MLRIGLTGNIGSGKSIIARVFETLGVPVYHADIEAKKFLNDKIVKLSLKEKFGNRIFDGQNINKKKLADIVFNNSNGLLFLNSLIHPLVKQDLLSWIGHHSGHAYIIQEAAILFESGFYKEFDKVIFVSAPENLMIKRVVERDGVSNEDVIKRLKNQWSSERKAGLADFIIYNDEIQLIIPQVLKIHNRFINLSN